MDRIKVVVVDENGVAHKGSIDPGASTGSIRRDILQALQKIERDGYDVRFPRELVPGAVFVIDKKIPSSFRLED